MSLQTIEVTGIPDEVVARIDAEAKARGIERETLLREWLAAHFAASRNVPALSSEESEVLQKINEGFSEEFWKRYSELAAKRNQRQHTTEEQAELLAHTDAVEAKNAERVGYLVRLAALRNLSLPELVTQLGLKPRPVPS